MYLTLMAEALPPAKFENLKVFQKLFPHAELALDYRPTHQKFLRHWEMILDYTGWYAFKQGDYKRSEILWRQAMHSSENSLGTEHPNTLTRVGNLALMLSCQGKFDEAETLD
jgi:tetratricopeptide (TPR) repeat protein